MDEDDSLVEPTLAFYENWKGNQLFYWQGRVVVSKTQWKNCIGTVLFISAVVGVFIYTAWLAKLSTTSMVFVGLMYLNSLVWFAWTAFMDPGFVPRHYERLPAAEDERFCTFCEVVKPPRRSHCRVCECCIDQFDHHCPWTGNCVGRRNYRSFIGFLLSLVALDIYMLATITTFAVQYIFSEGHDVHKFLEEFWLIPVLVYITGSTGCLLTAFLVYHLQLITKNMTTNELIRERTRANLQSSSDEDINRRPSSCSQWRQNWRRFFTSPIPP
ncbi:hypothetical protein THRCLA_04952, partial [Thraustotheca clavata]